MSGGTGESQDNSVKAFQFNRHALIDGKGGFVCTLTTEISVTTIDRKFETEQNISVLHNIKLNILTGNRMVDKQPSPDMKK